MAWNHFKEKLKKVILYPTISEREKRLYQKHMIDRRKLESLSIRQKQALSIRLKAEFEYRKTVFNFLVVTLFISAITGVWSMFFDFLKESFTLFVKNIHTLEESKIVWIISIILLVSVFTLMVVSVVIYLRNTYSIYKKLLLLEEIIKEEKQEE